MALTLITEFSGNPTQVSNILQGPEDRLLVHWGYLAGGQSYCFCGGYGGYL